MFPVQMEFASGLGLQIGRSTLEHKNFTAAYYRRQLLSTAIFLALALFSPSGQAQSTNTEANWPNVEVGMPIRDVIEILRTQRMQIAYSDSVLTEDMVVRSIPDSSNAVEALGEVLAIFQLRLFEADGIWAIGRSDELERDSEANEQSTSRQSTDTLAEIVVSASHYQMIRDPTALPNIIDQRVITEFPDFGEDPLRAVMRVPGVASSGSSARSFLRGSTASQTGVILDGHRLLDPFHVRDYQSLFSAIDVRVVDRMEVHTGGFPVEYGDATGGLILVDSLEASEDSHTELGLSVFNASILSYGQVANGDADWMASVRRGNLDLILNEDLGEPSYFDIFAKIGVYPTESTRLSFSGLLVQDEVLIVPAADPDEREESINDTRNAQFWITWDQNWSSRLFSRTLISVSDMQSRRVASIDDPEKIIGNIDDFRDVNVIRLIQNWSASAGDNHNFKFGAEFSETQTRYEYNADYGYFGLFRDLLSLPPSDSRSSLVDVDGGTIAVYFSDRWKINKKLTIDLGLRWDRQTYTDPSGDAQLSPRANLLFRPDSKSKIRVSWGRYHQSQGISELQVQDGVDQFHPAQSSDQVIVSWERRLNPRLNFRAESYFKSENRVMPRFENTLDPFSVVPELEPDRTHVVPTSSKGRGIELSLDFAPSKSRNYWMSYVFSQMTDKIAGIDVPRSWDQRHAFQIGAAFRGDRWSFSTAIKAHSGWPRTDVELLTDPETLSQSVVIGPRNVGRYDTFATLDMRLQYKRPIRRGSLSWFLEIANTSNRKNPCCVDFDLDPDGMGGAVLDKKEDFWFPVLPAIGVLWEF